MSAATFGKGTVDISTDGGATWERIDSAGQVVEFSYEGEAAQEFREMGEEWAAFIGRLRAQIMQMTVPLSQAVFTIKHEGKTVRAVMIGDKFYYVDEGQS